MGSLQVQSVARKLTSIGWLPPRAGHAYTDTELYFVSGSSGKHKELVLWRTENPDFGEGRHGDDKDSDEAAASLASLVAKTAHDGDVHAVAAAASDIVATASSYGTISVYNVSHEYEELSVRESVTAHRFANDEPAVATAIAVQPSASSDAEIASCGEDGKVAYAPLGRLDALQSYEVDSTVITGICWPTPSQVAVATRAGQVKLYDRRAPADVASVFIDPSQSFAFECITAHPSQSFRVATGTDKGAVLVWDVRNPKKPTTEAFNVHESSVWQVQFHPNDVSRIVSCSEDASLAVTEWTPGSAHRGVRHLSSFFNTLAVNCFDVCPFTRAGLLVAGADSGNLMLETEPATEFKMF
ncbi:hypothetical protein GGF46_000156 [Coemansia sp. RSA 552]|nr:hypothetical protein GGF46_000156 [Coemansia sp. RSA 552]